MAKLFYFFFFLCLGKVTFGQATAEVGATILQPAGTGECKIEKAAFFSLTPSPNEPALALPPLVGTPKNLELATFSINHHDAVYALTTASFEKTFVRRPEALLRLRVKPLPSLGPRDVFVVHLQATDEELPAELPGKFPVPEIIVNFN